MIIDIDPRVDIVFKKLFGSPDHPNLTLSFVNAILEVAGLPRAVNLSIQNPYTTGDFPENKVNVLDILYKDETGKDIQLEMQMEAHAGLAQRMIHNWTQVYNRQIDKGQDYPMHRPVISIWILNETQWGDGLWFHLFRFCCALSGQLLHDDACIITIELPVWIQLIRNTGGDILKGVEQWNYFLTQAKGKDSEELLATLVDPVFREAVDLMTDFNLIKRLRHAYDLRQETLHVIASYKRTGYEEGKAKGLVDGKAEGQAEGRAEGRAEALRDTARRMKARGLPIEDIVAITGLSVGEIGLV